jgi:hypothetical protein
MVSRIHRESKTVSVMIADYCRNHHTNKHLCSDCEKLLDYALQRLKKCPYQDGKTTCAKCPMHCYKPEMRDSIRKVMRYSGPRMILKHPVLAIYHLIDSRRTIPLKPALK